MVADLICRKQAWFPACLDLRHILPSCNLRRQTRVCVDLEEVFDGLQQDRRLCHPYVLQTENGPFGVKNFKRLNHNEEDRFVRTFVHLKADRDSDYSLTRRCVLSILPNRLKFPLGASQGINSRRSETVCRLAPSSDHPVVCFRCPMKVHWNQ